MIRWYHTCWTQALDETRQLYLCAYIHWFEGSLNDCAEHLNKRKLPSALLGAERIAHPCQSLTPEPGGSEVADERVSSWVRWLWPYAAVCNSDQNGARQRRCALIDRLQIGHRETFSQNGFEVPPALRQVRLTEPAPADGSEPPGPGAETEEASSALYPLIIEQLNRWWQDATYSIALPCVPARTVFQSQVQSSVCAIKPGATASYMQIARKINNAPRAVGQACRANHLPLIVPCHRVVGANSQGGYLGQDCQAGSNASALKQALVHREGGRLPAMPSPR